PADLAKTIRWVVPKLVCEVEYGGLTADQIVRQAAFKGLREDRPAEEVELETAAQRTPKGATSNRLTRQGVPIRLTHPDPILWAEQGVTKQGLAEFSTDIADWILPHLAGRVLSLVRCPSGVAEKCFFAKHAWAGISDAVRRVDVGGGDEPMLVIDDLGGVMTLVQGGVVEN